VSKTPHEEDSGSGAGVGAGNGHAPQRARSAVAEFVGKGTPAATVLALAAGGLASGFGFYPGDAHLPGIALNSGALYYVERAIVFFAGLMIALTLLARGLMAELPLKLGFGTGSVEYSQKVEAAVGGAVSAADHLLVPIGELSSRLADLERAAKLTTAMAFATAQEVKEHVKHVDPTAEPLDAESNQR
jgi:hypothetical protein